MQARNHRRVGVLQDLLGPNEEEVVTHSWMKSDLDSKIFKKSKKPTYVQVKDMIERKLAHQKRGMPTGDKVMSMVAEMNDDSSNEAIDTEVMESEIRRFAERMEKYNSPAVGSMTEEREEGKVRFMFCQLNNASSKAIRQQKRRGIIFFSKEVKCGNQALQ